MIDAGDHYKLMSTGLFLEGVHFDLACCPLQHLGYKVTVAGISNVIAMNGVPEQITVGLGVSSKFSLEALQTLYKGISSACQRYAIDLVGGDTVSSKSGLVLSIHVLGRGKKDQVCYRSGAKLNDVLCVTGDLGGAYIGLQVLAREKLAFNVDVDTKSQLEPYQYMLQRQLKPEARVDILDVWDDLEISPTSMIDVSDGLSSELLHLSKASQVGVQIYEDKLPIDHRTYKTAVSLHLDPITCAMHGGEDYELLFTIGVGDVKKIEKHPDISPVGYITSEERGCSMVTKAGNQVEISDPGWESSTNNGGG